jgi:hypothetical protein
MPPLPDPLPDKFVEEREKKSLTKSEVRAVEIC